ncbi:protein NLRC3-like [Ornithodoros turicata]|uniref:protein NLRC3-like n=1 Tax=Ornithodoros turicata TaxID=34597 RepID=UPI003139A233
MFPRSRRMTQREFQRLLDELLHFTRGALDLRARLLHDAEALIVSDVISKCHDLTALDLSDNALTFIGLEAICNAIAENNKIVCLAVSGNDLDNRALEVLAGTVICRGSIEVLTLSRNRISDEGLFKFSEALRENRTVHELDLSNNIIGPRGAQCLFEALFDNDVIRDVDLSFNCVGDKSREDFARLLSDESAPPEIMDKSVDWMNALGGVLKKSRILREINVRANYIYNVDGLAEGIALSTCLRKLDLAQNLLDDDAVQKLAAALKTNQSIRWLNLSHQRTKLSSGIIALAESLEANSTLTHLALQGDLVSAEGLVAISRMLTVNRTLYDLDLSYNKVDAISMTVFANAMSLNKGITHLTFHRMNKFAAEELAETVQSNRYICSITVNTLQDPLLKRARELVHRVTSTNCQAYCKALRFATLHTSFDNALASAFEVFSSNKAFLDRLEEATGTDPKCLVFSKRLFIANNYFRITKVVKRHLVCEELPVSTGKSQLQLDALNEYCLMLICSYLEVSDVRPSEATPVNSEEKPSIWRVLSDLVKY